MSIRRVCAVVVLLAAACWARGEDTATAAGPSPSSPAAASATPFEPTVQALPAPVPTAPQPSATAPTRMSTSPTVGGGIATANPLTALLGLVLVVALIVATAWLMKRLGAGQVGASGGMKIVAGLAVGPREKVLLIEVGERQVLIGVASGRVSLLQSFDEPVISGQSSAVDFSSRLQALLQRGNRAGVAR